ncbi:MAG: MBL fold metallo-hydrolase [Hungatella sp.]|jgi:flavorubredoxin|nr:MBL fold metallo-hydrolase [Hungatella sp.]
MDKQDLNYNEYVKIAEGVYWVGFFDENAGLHCNPYLIADGDEAVLIDSGSREDFSTVMLKVMRTGVSPGRISRLIYQHYDPDLCGNIPHIETLINSEDLKIISHHENNIFINYYSVSTPKQCIEQLGFHFEFASGRRLEFIRTPYSHSPGSFVTYDVKTKILFSSDIFGSYDHNWSLFTLIGHECRDCTPRKICPITQKVCQIKGIINFHQRNMPSKKALEYALERIEKLDISLIAPQHGSILDTFEAQEIVIKRLRELTKVGIDYFLEDEEH